MIFLHFMPVSFLKSQKLQSLHEGRSTSEYIHTFIHNWTLQPFSQDYWLTFAHHFRFVRLNAQTANDSFFEKLYMAILFYFLFYRARARNMLRGNRRRNTFCILFWWLAWDSNPGFTSNKPTLYLLDYGAYTYE